MVEKLCEYSFNFFFIITIFFLQLSGCNNYFYDLIALFKLNSFIHYLNVSVNEVYIDNTVQKYYIFVTCKTALLF